MMFLLYFIFFQIFYLCLGVVNKQYSKLKLLIYSMVISVVPVYLIALNSLSRLSILDVLFSLIAISVVCWYVGKTVK